MENGSNLPLPSTPSPRNPAAIALVGQPAAAAESLKKLLAKNWPTRFGDVHRDARAKLVELEKKAG